MNESQPVIEVKNLSRRFKRKTTLDNVSFDVPRGCVFGLLGENGAGKTTLIKHLLGLLKPETGSVRVFGRDPIADPEGALSRIGYLSEHRVLPEWMRIDELMWYTQAFYPSWDEGFAEELRKNFNLDAAAKVRELSRGERAKVGLLAALAHRPDLLLLDEPSSGLDPIVRQHILRAIIRTVADEGRTVLFSSHHLDEVERVSDYIAIMHQGRIAAVDRLDTMKETHHRLVLVFESPQAAHPRVEGALAAIRLSSAKEWAVICNGQREQVHAAARRLNAAVVEESRPSLEDIFVAYAATPSAGAE